MPLVNAPPFTVSFPLSSPVFFLRVSSPPPHHINTRSDEDALSSRILARILSATEQRRFIIRRINRFAPEVINLAELRHNLQAVRGVLVRGQS